MIKLFFSITLVVFCSCSQEKPVESIKDKQSKIETVNPGYSLETFESANGWGYTILNEGKPFIIQKHIPSMQGTNGFSNKNFAEKCGNFIINKLENGIMPPSVSKEELLELGVLN